MGDQIINIDLAFHIPVDNLGNVCAAPCTSKGRPLPLAARYQLERAGGDLCPGFGHADDDGLTPTPMASFKRLAHDLGIAYALERIIGPTVRQLDDVVDDVLDLLGVDEMRHAELAGHGFALGVQVYAYDLVGTHHLGALNNVQADTAQTKYHHIGSGLDLGGVQHRTQSGRDTATDVADLVERGIAADLGQRDFRHHNVIGKCRGAHVVVHRLAAHRKSRGAIRHQPLALGGAYCRAQVGLA